MLNALRPPAGSSFAVTGAGAVGLAAVMAARVAGCTTIVAIDLHDSRLELAREVVPPTPSTPGRPTCLASCRTSPEATASTTSSTHRGPAVVSGAAGALAIRGTLALVGAAAPGTEARLRIDVASLLKGWTFKTIVQGSSVPQVFIPALIELWKQGRFPRRQARPDLQIGRYQHGVHRLRVRGDGQAGHRLLTASDVGTGRSPHKWRHTG